MKLIRTSTITAMTAGLALVGHAAPSEAVILDSSFQEDWQGQSFPSPWVYQSTNWDDVNDPSSYNDLLWDGSNWEVHTGEANWIDDEFFRLNDAGADQNTFVIGWQSPADGVLDMKLDGEIWRSGSDQFHYGILDHDGDVIAEYVEDVSPGTNTFAQDGALVDIPINAGEFVYVYAYQPPEHGDDQLWGFTENRGAPWGDGIRITLIPEPGTVALLGMGGLLLMRRGRARRA